MTLFGFGKKKEKEINAPVCTCNGNCSVEKSRTVQNLNTPNMKLTRPGLWRPDETSQAADHLD